MKVPDFSEPWWGLPRESVADALEARRSEPLPSHFSDPEESRAVVMLAAAYPSLRRAVLESVVEDVAKEIADAALLYAPKRERWDDLSVWDQATYRDAARRALGLASEGETDHG